MPDTALINAKWNLSWILFEKKDMKKSTPPSAFLQQNNYLKKGGELIITYQLEYYEKNLISSIYIRCLSVYGYMISIKHEEIV